MNRTRAVVVGSVLLLLLVAVALFKFWPKKQEVGQTMPQALVFWNDQDAFVFLNLSTTGRAQNIFQEKVAGTRYGYLSVFAGGFMDFVKQDVVAFHLNSAGELTRFALPEGTTTTGSWSLASGQLQLTATDYGTRVVKGFRWDGSQFESLPAEPKPQTSPAAGGSQLSADDEDEDADDAYALMSKSSRQQFKSASWHYKFLNGYGGGGSNQATLPITVAGSSYDLTTESTPFGRNGSGSFDLLSVGIKVLRISGGKLPASGQVLFDRAGWREISKEEYGQLKQRFGRQGIYQSPMQWTWLIVLAIFLVWRFGGWLHVLLTLFTVKGRVLKNMATSFSFPPATTSQFPLLDLAALDRYTREFEALGFTRLLDFSLVSNSSQSAPNFCRLFAHTRHHCFGTVRQFFPKGKPPMTLSFGFESCLQNGWTLGFANNKPQATSSLIRRPKALGVCMPDATSSDVLQAFLKMRDQVCLDLGISPVNDDTVEAFFAKTQRTATEAREAVKQKSFATGLPEVYARKALVDENQAGICLAR